MATTITGLEILQAVIRATGNSVGKYLPDARQSVSTTALTAATDLANGNVSTNHYRSSNTIVFMPGSTTAAFADAWRRAGDLAPSTGVITFDRALSANTGITDVYLLYNNTEPQDFLDAFVKALRMCHFPTIEPFSSKPTGTTLTDAGFQNSAVTYWVESEADGGAATTFTKLSTANSEKGYRGVNAGRLVNSAAGGYVRQRFAVTAGEQLVGFALTRLETGTNFQHILYDNTNAAAIGTTVSHAQGAWQYSRRVETAPSGCKIVEVRLGGEGASDEVNMSGHWFYHGEMRHIVLDTMWDPTPWALPKLMYVDLRGVSVSGDVYAADSAELKEVPKSAYDIEADPAGIHEISVQLHDPEFLQYPIYIQGRRALSDLTTPTLLLTETTPGDLDGLCAAVRVEMFKDGGTASQVPNAPRLWAEAQREFDSYRSQFAPSSPAEKPSIVLSMGLRP